MKCELISVGTEILLGDILNTNAQYLSRELACLGIGVMHHSTVGDNSERLRADARNSFFITDPPCGVVFYKLSIARLALKCKGRALLYALFLVFWNYSFSSAKRDFKPRGAL